jgi:hypothetical protein
MPPIFEAPRTNPPNPFTLFPELAVEAVIWIAAQLRNAGETFLWICSLPLSFASWVIQASTETLYWLYAMLVVSAEILILLVAACIGCLLMVLILAVVCTALSRSWTYADMRSQRVLLVPELQPSIHGREQALATADQNQYGTMSTTSSGTIVSRTKIEEFRGLGWRHTIWQTVTRHTNGRRATPKRKDSQGVVDTQAEKLDKYQGA